MKRVLGEDHHHTLTAMGILAALYHDLQRYEEAVELRQQILGIRKEALGEEHYDTIRTMGSLGAGTGGSSVTTRPKR